MLIPVRGPVRKNREPFKGKIGVDGGWDRVFGGLETFLDLFVIFRPKVDVLLIETLFLHNKNLVDVERSQLSTIKVIPVRKDERTRL